MKVGFRADASMELGTGHLMRCSTLAESLRLMGAKIVFFSKSQPEWMRPALEAEDTEFVQLPDHIGEVDTMNSWLTGANEKLDWLVIDHYEWDASLETRVAPFCSRIMVIDDLANRRHHCDLLLDQNELLLAKERYRELLPPKARALLGSRYALLRREFAEARSRLGERDGNVRKLLVCFGGSDPTNETAKVLRALDSSVFSALRINVVIGSRHNDVDQIRDYCESDSRFTLHIQTNRMAELMAESDLAICAGGTMTWERYCMSLPGIVIAVADNQIAIAEAGQLSGIDLYLGRTNHVQEDAIQSALCTMMENSDLLRKASLLARERVDGKGVSRVTKEMMTK